jgi:hypothetical protein
MEWYTVTRSVKAAVHNTQRTLTPLSESFIRVWRVALGLIVLLIGLGVVSDWSARSQAAQLAEIDAFRQSARESVQYADSLSELVEARQKAIDTLKAEVVRLKGRRPVFPTVEIERARADSLYAELSDSVRAAYEIIPLQQRIIARQDSTIAVLDSTVTVQDDIIGLQDSNIVSLRLVADSLRTVLLRPPKPPTQERLFGLFPMPSRKTVAVVSYVAGVASVIWVGTKM